MGKDHYLKLNVEHPNAFIGGILFQRSMFNPAIRTRTLLEHEMIIITASSDTRGNEGCQIRPIYPSAHCERKELGPTQNIDNYLKS
ncbi:hypothetical protein JB92DRAFT_3064537 [Gautieria morchelliformis]|nr:hypothetical protein JB92DRAFT_3064537 [Gautieria morchelliformis]